MITLNWTGTRTDGDDHYIVGTWLVDGVTQGIVETPATSDFQQVIPDSRSLEQLEVSLLV